MPIAILIKLVDDLADALTGIRSGGRTAVAYSSKDLLLFRGLRIPLGFVLLSEFSLYRF